MFSFGVVRDAIVESLKDEGFISTIEFAVEAFKSHPTF